MKVSLGMLNTAERMLIDELAWVRKSNFHKTKTIEETTQEQHALLEKLTWVRSFIDPRMKAQDIEIVNNEWRELSVLCNRAFPDPEPHTCPQCKGVFDVNDWSLSCACCIECSNQAPETAEGYIGGIKGD